MRNNLIISYFFDNVKFDRKHIILNDSWGVKFDTYIKVYEENLIAVNI